MNMWRFSNIFWSRHSVNFGNVSARMWKCGGSTNVHRKITNGLTKQFENTTSIFTQSYNWHHGRNPNFPQSLPWETWECIRSHHAETPGEPVELIVLSRDDPGIPHHGKNLGFRLRRSSNYAGQWCQILVHCTLKSSKQNNIGETNKILLGTRAGWIGPQPICQYRWILSSENRDIDMSYMRPH